MRLQTKILAGYLVLVAVICSMAAILVHERGRMHEIETEAGEIQEIRRDITVAQRNIITLATLGEGVIGWEEADYRHYRIRRLRTDSLLQAMKPRCKDFVHPAQIDTLRALLVEKEAHLLHLMETFARQDKADSLLVNHLPEVAKRATRVRTVTQKKKGIAGAFGGKKTVQILPSAKELHQFSDSLIAMQQERTAEMEAYTDSLRTLGRRLNAELNRLITELDGQAQEAFVQKERKIAEAQALSVRLFTATISAAIVLLVISHFVIVRDLRRRDRDRRRLEEAVTQNRNLSDMRKKVIMTLSHDIRGPLNAISGSAELAMNTRDRKRRNAYLTDIIGSARHITQLANSLLDLSRLNEAKETLNPIPFRLIPFLDRIAAEYTRPANDRGLLFSRDINVPDITVSGDADRMEQILDNLLSNAIKFTKSGSVTLSALYEKEILTVRIQDTGIGMDEKTVERIFQPFERAAPEVDAEGFGLGLAITRGLVSLLKGEISVSSHPGEGSSFEIRIPLSPTDEPVKDTAIPIEGRLSLPQRVLVVDNDPIQLRIVGEMLERNGVSCCKCQNAQSVVNELRRTRYDIILTDIQMRGTGGFDLLYLLRHSNIGDSKTVPVAAMTARNDGNGCRYSEAGFSGCIRKPFSMNELLAFLSSITEKEKAAQPTSADFFALAADVEDRKWILETFIGESLKNKAELQESLSDMEMDFGRMRETLHRMYPVWEQLGISHELEGYSEILHDDGSDGDTVQRHTEEIIGRICGLIAEAERLLSETGNGQQ